jgi:hypothetical protein
MRSSARAKLLQPSTCSTCVVYSRDRSFYGTYYNDDDYVVGYASHRRTAVNVVVGSREDRTRTARRSTHLLRVRNLPSAKVGAWRMPEDHSMNAASCWNPAFSLPDREVPHWFFVHSPHIAADSWLSFRFIGAERCR